MTIKDYISTKFISFGVSEADLVDFCFLLPNDLTLDSEYTKENSESIGKPLIVFIESLFLKPRQTNISENGFSISWNYDNLMQWYLMLCKKYIVQPNVDVLSHDLSVIFDKTDRW